ncbi:hypothetical protein KKC97_13305 [bacterium]|nr:hypothetical protein [bacterium]MBU1638634.1 hypothetical protein [bacterium]MBU1919881.1 hypothetical protein [bacterium]
MPRFLFRLFIFLVLLTVISAGISMYYNEFVMKYSILLRKERQFEAFCDSTKYLFLGDSHIMHGFNPDSIGGSFNLAMSSENTMQTYFRLRYLLNESPCGKNIRCVFLPFEQHTFSSQRLNVYPETAWSITWYYRQFVDSFEEDEYADNWFSLAKLHLQFYLWSYRNQGMVIAQSPANWFGKPDSLRPILKGYLPRCENFSILPDSLQISYSKERSVYHFDPSKYNLHEPVLIEFFEKILKLCESKNIPVILLSLPVTREYYECGKNEFGIGTEHHELDSVLARYSKIYRLDYTDMFFDRNEYFADPDHVNEAGANLLSKKIAEDIAVLGL